MVNCRDILLKHAEYKVAESRLKRNDTDFRAWSEAVLILQGLRTITQPSQLAKHQNVKDKWERRFSAGVYNELVKVMHGGRKGRDLNMTQLDLAGAPEITPVDKLYAGSARSALLIGLLPFSEVRPATKEELILGARPHTHEDLDAACDIKYGGWPEMNLLVRHGLAVKNGKYYRKKSETYTFWLTDLGRSWAEKVRPDGTASRHQGFEAFFGHVMRQSGEMTPAKKRPLDITDLGSSQKAIRQTFPYALPSGSTVSVGGLTKTPELNGQTGRVSFWDPNTGRYGIDLGGVTKALRPSKVTQRCVVKIEGVVGRPELNGLAAQIMEFDNSSGRYRVYVKQTGCEFKLKPANVVLPDKTPVVFRGVPTSQAPNDEMGVVRCYDADDRTYFIETRGGKRLFEVKCEEVVC